MFFAPVCVALRLKKVPEVTLIIFATPEPICPVVCSAYTFHLNLLSIWSVCVCARACVCVWVYIQPSCQVTVVEISVNRYVHMKLNLQAADSVSEKEVKIIPRKGNSVFFLGMGHDFNAQISMNSLNIKVLI